MTTTQTTYTITSTAHITMPVGKAAALTRKGLHSIGWGRIELLSIIRSQDDLAWVITHRVSDAGGAVFRCTDCRDVGVVGPDGEPCHCGDAPEALDPSIWVLVEENGVPVNEGVSDA